MKTWQSALLWCILLMMFVSQVTTYVAWRNAERQIDVLGNELQKYRIETSKLKTATDCHANTLDELIRDIVQDWKTYPDYSSKAEIDIIDEYRR